MIHSRKVKFSKLYIITISIIVFTFPYLYYLISSRYHDNICLTSLSVNSEMNKIEGAFDDLYYRSSINYQKSIRKTEFSSCCSVKNYGFEGDYTGFSSYLLGKGTHYVWIDGRYIPFGVRIDGGPIQAKRISRNGTDSHLALRILRRWGNRDYAVIAVDNCGKTPNTRKI